MSVASSLVESIYSAAGVAAATVYQGVDGLYYLYNLENHFMGTYNPVLNATYTAYGKFVDYGNQLRILAGV